MKSRWVLWLLILEDTSSCIWFTLLDHAITYCGWMDYKLRSQQDGDVCLVSVSFEERVPLKASAQV
jgi:hypothetical protein